MRLKTFVKTQSGLCASATASVEITKYDPGIKLSFARRNVGKILIASRQSASFAAEVPSTNVSNHGYQFQPPLRLLQQVNTVPYGGHVSFHLPVSYLSSLDKHRELHLPDRLTPELSLEMGIDLGDGCLFHSPVISRRGSYYVCSISQRFPDEWFGIELILKPLVKRLYNLMPKSKHSSLSRNGINVYTYSRGLFFFKSKVLGLPAGPRSADIVLPSVLSHSIHEARFWTGYQYADGSFYCTGSTRPVIKLTSSSPRLLTSLRRFARLLGVEFSFGREHSGTGYSVRILSEQSIMKWVEHVPLLNPVHAARFFLWRSGTGCPPGLHLSQYMDLALGAKDGSDLAQNVGEQGQRRYLEESVFLISLACIGHRRIGFDDWWHRANLASCEHAKMTVKSLVKEGYVRKSGDADECWLELKDRGFARLKELDLFFGKLDEITLMSNVVSPN
jgi:hypothetical protein